VSGTAPELVPLLEGLAEETRREAEALVGAARQRAEEALARAALEASRLEAEAESEGRREGEREARRRMALARIEARQDELRQRDAEVARAIEAALRRLEARAEGPEGGALLAALVQDAARALGERRVRVQVREADRERLAAALAGTDLEPLFDAEPLGEPGALVRAGDGRRLVDATLAGILRLRRPAARRAAAAALFPRGAP
jgi:vacuolar-type H+-ATPase subunit E/Vma4